MKELLLMGLFLGNMVVTSYRSTPKQCKPTGYKYTSIGERCNVHGVAASQDLLLSGKVHYGDLVYIESVGFKFVNDTMHPRMKEHFDVWVQGYEDEKAFDAKFHGKTLRVWVIKI